MLRGGFLDHTLSMHSYLDYSNWVWVDKTEVQTGVVFTRITLVCREDPHTYIFIPKILHKFSHQIGSIFSLIDSYFWPTLFFYQYMFWFVQLYQKYAKFACNQTHYTHKSHTLSTRSKTFPYGNLTLNVFFYDEALEPLQGPSKSIFSYALVWRSIIIYHIQILYGVKLEVVVGFTQV